MKYEDLPSREKPAKTAQSLFAGIRNADTREPEQATTWTVSASVLVAALQRHTDDQGVPLLRIKGGAYLEWAFHPAARATQDVDAFFTAGATEFDEFLRRALTEPMGDFSFIIKQRSSEIPVKTAAFKPRRHEIQVLFARKLLRKVVLEVSFSEGHMARMVGSVEAPRLEPFGVPTPTEAFASISPEYQVAQKLHACTGPGSADRERDVLDILLLKRNVFDAAGTSAALATACADIFSTRAAFAAQNDLAATIWPTEIVQNMAGGRTMDASLDY